MAVSIIANTIRSLMEEPIVGVKVTITLMPGPCFRVVDGSEIAPTREFVTDETGTWTAPLERQSGITPNNSYYLIKEEIPPESGDTRLWTILVPDNNALMRECLVSTAPSPYNPIYVATDEFDALDSIYVRIDAINGYVEPAVIAEVAEELGVHIADAADPHAAADYVTQTELDAALDAFDPGDGIDEAAVQALIDASVTVVPNGLVTDPDGGAVDLRRKSFAEITLTSNAAISFSNMDALQLCEVTLIQDVTGEWDPAINGVTWEGDPVVLNGDAFTRTSFWVKTKDTGVTKLASHNQRRLMVPFSWPGIVAVAVNAPPHMLERRTRFLGYRLSARVAPTGSDVIVDILLNGSSIFSSPGDRPTLAVADNDTGRVTVVGDVSTEFVGEGDWLSVSTIQADSGGTAAFMAIKLFLQEC